VAYYLVRARSKPSLLGELRARLDRDDLRPLRPFGEAITVGLNGARLDPESGEAIWEEEDYCSPPLAMERASVLDRYFEDLAVERLERGIGWSRITALPSLWDKES